MSNTIPKFTKPPILVPLDVLNFVHAGIAIKKEFNWPVVGITALQRIEREFTADLRSQYDYIFSFPEFYRQHGEFIQSAAVDAIDARQAEIEQKYGTPTSNLLTSYDRCIALNSDYETVRRRQVAYLMFADHILSNVQPSFMLSCWGTYFHSFMILACARLGIPRIMGDSPRMGLRVGFARDDFRYHMLEETMDKLNSNGPDEFDQKVIDEADAWYDSFLNIPSQPVYAAINNRTSFSVLKSLRNAMTALNPSLLRTLYTHKIDQEMGYYANPLKCLGVGFLSRLRSMAQRNGKIFDAAPDMERPYFYFPLHMAPEISDMVQGSLYDHPEGTVFQLAKRIPTGHMLYVKEHPSMIGLRPSSFYRNFKKIHNVKLIHPSVNTFELIKASRGLITVTSTAGWEAYLLSKPVIVFGNVFYNVMPNVLHCNLDDDFDAKLADYLQSFATSSDTIRNAVRAMFLLSYSTEDTDFLRGIERATNKKISEQTSFYAKAMHHFIKTRLAVIDGTFPESFIDNL